jgi:hypothetical protein
MYCDVDMGKIYSHMGYEMRMSISHHDAPAPCRVMAPNAYRAYILAYTISKPI